MMSVMEDDGMMPVMEDDGMMSVMKDDGMTSAHRGTVGTIDYVAPVY